MTLSESSHQRNYITHARIILLLLFFVGNTAGFSQDLKFDHLTVKHGLSQGNIVDIYQDHLGFIWIGTEDGLNMFDGYTFTIYRNIPSDSNSISNNNIHCIIEDKNGNLWIGTQKGVNFYNRKLNHFDQYLNTPEIKSSLSNSNVACLLIDSKENLWVGTADGLNQFDPATKSFKHFAITVEDSTILNNTINSIVEDTEKQIWVGTLRGGVSLINPDGTFTNFVYDPKDPTTLSSNKITKMIAGKSNDLWIGTFDGGLNRMNLSEKKFTRYQHAIGNLKSLGNDYVVSLTQSHTGELWIATDGALNKLNLKDGTFEQYNQKPGDENSLSSNIITKVMFDVDDRMWVGTRFGGINTYDKRKYSFTHFKNNYYDKNSLSNNTVTAFEDDGNGNFWIATDGGGLNYFDRQTKQFTRYNTIFTNDKILALEKDLNGGLWIGMWGGGLNYYNSKTKKLRRYLNDPKDPNSLSDNNIFYILRDHNGIIWIGTYGNGLNRYNAETDNFTRFVHNPNNTNSISSTPIDYLIEDSSGKLWIGTSQDGLDFFDPKENTFTHYKTAKTKGSISDNSLYAIFEDSKKRLWAGTGSGLNLFDPATKTFSAFHQVDGLPTDAIMGIQEDSHGMLWISTNKGLCRFDTEKLLFKNFSKSDGLQDDQFNRWAVAKLTTGELLFGGTNGFNLFHPDSIKENTFKPPVYIIDFKLFNKPVNIGEDEVLKQNIMLTKEIELSYLQNVFSFEFTALNYSQPEKNKYRYKLEEFQNDWVEAGQERKVSYTNLNPGEYVFKVIASNNDGIWNNEGTSIKIVVIPPYWQSWWFRLLVILGVITSIFGFFKIRENSINTQKVKLEEEVRKSTQEMKNQRDALEAQAENLQTLNEQQQAQTDFLSTLNEALQQQKEEVIAKQEEAEKARQDAEKANQAKSIFLATMSHEIRTPMNGVLGMAALLAETKLTQEQQEYADTITSSGEALLTVINDILDFSKIESGNLELDNHSFDLRKCLEDVLDLFSPKAAQKGLDLVYQIDYQIPAQIVGDSHRLRQVLINIISNAMKFTHHGEIFVSIDLVKTDANEMELAFHVRDTGIGIPQDKLSRLFKAFSQVDSSTTRKYGGTGLGLVISQRLVELMGGAISVESEPSVGTTFIFTLKSTVSQETLKQYVHCNTVGSEGKKVLLVDDNATNRIILKNQLEQWKLLPTLASSGQQALEILIQEKFDLIITDMQMPEMDGIELSQKIKSKNSSIPIILLSSVGEESKNKYVELFSTVLNKPVKQQPFCRAIQIAFKSESTIATVEDIKTKNILSDDFAEKYPLQILLAEDNPVNQKLAVRVLNKLGYQNIVIAQNGLEAIEKLNKQFFEVILMDVQMPEMDGLEATRNIRSLNGKQPIIISMTANAMQEDKEACIKAGMNDYISKPIKLTELITALQKAFESFNVEGAS